MATDLDALFNAFRDDDDEEENTSLCIACLTGEMQIDKISLICNHCGYIIDRISTGNARYGKTDGVSINISGDQASQYRNFLMKDGNKDSSITRREGIANKFKHRNFLNGNIIPARVINDATESYYQATITKTFRAENAIQVMSACLYYACRANKFYKTDVEVSEFMGSKSRGISIGRVMLNKLARSNNNIMPSCSIDVIDETASYVIERIKINDNPNDKIAIIAMINVTYEENIEPSYTILTRTLGLIRIYAELIKTLRSSDGYEITTEYLNEKINISSSTIDKSYRDFIKYRSRLIRAIKVALL